MNKTDGKNKDSARSSYNGYKYATLKAASDSSTSNSEDEEYVGNKGRIIEKQPTTSRKTNNNGKQSEPLDLTDLASPQHHEKQNGRAPTTSGNSGGLSDDERRTTTLWSKICNFFTCGQMLFWGELYFPDYKFFEVNI